MLHKKSDVVNHCTTSGRLGNQEGSTFVEYLVLMAFVSFTVAAAMAALGIPLLRYFHYAQFVLSAPIP